MSFLKRLFRKKEVEEEVMPEEEVEALDVEVEESKGEEDDTLMKINERLNDIENRLPRIDVSLNNLKREIDKLRDDLQKLDDSMKDMMTLYEVVSAQINPFVGASKVTALSVERIDALEKKLSEIEETILDFQRDLRLLFRHKLDMKEIVNEVLYGEVFSE